MFWDPTLEIGVTEPDAQHREFFRQVSSLRDERNPDRVADTFFFLDHFMKRHFREEEWLHYKSDFPKKEEHRRHHRMFARAYAVLKQRYDANGDTPALLEEMNKVVVGWLKGHIMILDKEFADFNNGEESRSGGVPDGCGHFARTVFKTDNAPPPPVRKTRWWKNVD